MLDQGKCRIVECAINVIWQVVKIDIISSCITPGIPNNCYLCHAGQDCRHDILQTNVFSYCP